MAAIIDEIQRTDVPFGSLAVWWLGQSGFCIKGGSTTLYIDLFLRDTRSRNYPPDVQPSDLTNANYIFCTHEHIDHYDVATVPPVMQASPQATLILPKWVEETAIKDGVPAERILTFAEEETRELEGLQVTMIAAVHAPTLKNDTYGFHHDPQLGYRWQGYILELNGVSIYHSGDTLDYPGLTEKLQAHRIDVALLPINGRYYEREIAHDIAGNMNFREAADLAVRAGLGMVIPTHYDLFAGNYEKPGYFADYINERHPHQLFHILTRTRKFMFTK